MVHPVKTPLGAVRALTSASLSAARHPIRTVGEAATLGRGLVTAVVTGHLPDHAPVHVEMDDALAEPAPADGHGSLKRQGDPLTDASVAADQATDPEANRAEEQTDGLADALADAPDEPGEQVVTEPSSVTAAGDDEEIPSPAVQPVDEDVEVVTPVGTTGAGPGYNPDTTETDLQQPGTEPLMDPSTTKRIKSETDTLRKAADTDKG